MLFTIPLEGVKSPLPDCMNFSIGPTVYHLLRERHGGAVQKGLMAGMTGVLERRKANSIYIAAEGYFAKGVLYGHTSSDLELNSRMIEAQVEGRAGYTMCREFCKQLMVTPYLGYGYFECTNRLIAPSPTLITYHDKYEYLAAGLLHRYHFCPELSIGLDFKGRFSFVGRSHVQDPRFNNPTLTMGDVMQYEILIPVRYDGCYCGWKWNWQLEPFYLFRVYHQKDNFPFDFIKTRFHLWGLKAEFGIGF